MEDRSGVTFIVTLVFTILGTIFVALRLVSRGLVVKKVDWADGLVVLAWVRMSHLPRRDANADFLRMVSSERVAPRLPS